MAKATSQASRDGSVTGIVGRVKTAGGGLTVRFAPTLRATPLDLKLRNGEAVRITCQTRGDQVRGTFGVSSIWNRLPNGGYVSDAFVSTGFDGWATRYCPQGPGEDMHDALRKVEQSHDRNEVGAARDGITGRVKTNGAPLRVRFAPTLRSTPLDIRLRNGAQVEITCQTRGDEVRGTFGRSSIWNKLPNGGYVSDSYVFTGTDGPATRSCVQGPGEDMISVLRQVQKSHDEVAAGARRADTFEALDTWWLGLRQSDRAQRVWQLVYASALRRVSQDMALRQARIDVREWQPQEGFVANRDTVVKVYDYYRSLFVDRPELRWAGMARLAGAPVYAGLQDTSFTPDVFSGPAFVERQLLEMQKAIFEDLAWQHELYRHQGIEGIRAVYAGFSFMFSDAGPRNREVVGDTRMLPAWEDIASGDESRIRRGNLILVTREQDAVLQPYYDDIFRQQLRLTRVTSRVAASPINGGIPFHDVEGLTYCLPLGGIQPPFREQCWPNISHSPQGQAQFLEPNVALWEDRQRWIYQDMFPKYVDWYARNPQGLRAEIDIPLQERAKRFNSKLRGAVHLVI